LDAIAFTLNHIWLQDRSTKMPAYTDVDESMKDVIAAEESQK
jgi:hypothetical protein